MQVHYVLYADNGTGVPALRIVGEAAFMIGTLGLMFCLFALAKGWNITTSKLNNKKCPKTQTARTRTRTHTCRAGGVAYRNARRGHNCTRWLLLVIVALWATYMSLFAAEAAADKAAVLYKYESIPGQIILALNLVSLRFSLPLISILITLNTTLNTILTTLNFDSHYLNTIITTVNQTTDALDAISSSLN